MSMNRLTESDDCGNWRLKGVPWKDLYEGAVITKETREKLYGALWKLMQYEATGLSPEEVEDLNDFEKSQVGILLKQLSEEKNKHRWIPVSERLPKEDGFYIASFAANPTAEEEPFIGLVDLEDIEWSKGWIVAWKPQPEPYVPEESVKSEVSE